jgi:hypothetical protein
VLWGLLWGLRHVLTAPSTPPPLPETAAQLWGVLWGLARLRHVPRDAWMARCLQCCDAVMGEFRAEELAHLAWALGAMGYVPEKPWLRALTGQVCVCKMEVHA